MSRKSQVNEKRCQVIDGSDYISQLPESVTSHILSRLPTRDAVRTSILSKDWVYKWTSIDNININDGERLSKGTGRLAKTSFQNFVDRVLFLSRDFKKFRLFCWERYKFDCLEVWITTALSRNIEKLELTLLTSRDFKVPRSICNNTHLKEMKLVTCTLKVPQDNYFPNITNLYLGGVRIRGLKNDEPIVFTFPVLKTCLLIGCEWYAQFVEIHSPALSTLKCEALCLSERPWVTYSINISGASLGKFEYSGDFPERITLNESKVLSADFKNYSHESSIFQVRKGGIRLRNLLKGFSDITNLQLSAWTCKALASAEEDLPLPQFDKLQRLVMSVSGNAKLLLELLHSAPSLAFLEIEVYENLAGLDRDVAAFVPHCVVSHLKEVKFNKSCGKPPFLLAKFLVANGLELRKVYLDCSRKDEIVEQLLTFPRASACLTII